MNDWIMIGIVIFLVYKLDRIKDQITTLEKIVNKQCLIETKDE